MTQDDENKPKRRRRGEKKSQKGISVYLTFQEWRFLRAAASKLGKSIAFMMREYTIDRIEQDTDLKLGDFSPLTRGFLAKLTHSCSETWEDVCDH